MNRKEFYEENGYWIERNLVKYEEMAELFTMFYDISMSMALRTGIKPDVPPTAEARYPDHMKELDRLMLEIFNYDKDLIGEIYDTVSYTFTFQRFFSNPRFEGVTKDLLGLASFSSLYGWTNRIRIDPPKDERRTYGWHQEVFYTLPKSRFLQTWCPILRDTTKDNGTIEVCPGSHKEGVVAQSWTDVEGGATQIIIDQAIVEKYDPLVLEMTVGDVLFFNGHLFHQSGRNTTVDEIRFSLVGMWNDVSRAEFRAPMPTFNYRGMSNRDYFDAMFPGSSS